MTRARPAAKGLVTPPPLHRWMDAVLLLCVSLVQSVRATFGMWRRNRQGDWHTAPEPHALPQMKPDTHIKESSSTHGVIPGLVPGISVRPSRGLANAPLENRNRDSRDALRLPGNGAADVALTVQPPCCHSSRTPKGEELEPRSHAHAHLNTHLHAHATRLRRFAHHDRPSAPLT